MDKTMGQSDPYNNNASASVNVEDTHDSVNDVKNIITPEEKPKPMDNNTEDVTYTRTAQNLVYQCTEVSKSKMGKPIADSDCDLMNQEGADRFRAEVERLKN